MRRLLYPLVFALVLFLAGSAVTLGGDIPHSGGTVPGEGVQVWLPVVGNALSRACPYIPIPLYPEVNAVNPYLWGVQTVVVGESGLGIWETIFTAHKNSQSIDALDTWSSRFNSTDPLISYHAPELPPGEYCWRARLVCYSGKGFADGGRTEGCRSFRLE